MKGLDPDQVRFPRETGSATPPDARCHGSSGTGSFPAPGLLWGAGHVIDGRRRSSRVYEWGAGFRAQATYRQGVLKTDDLVSPTVRRSFAFLDFPLSYVMSYRCTRSQDESDSTWISRADVVASRTGNRLQGPGRPVTGRGESRMTLPGVIDGVTKNRHLYAGRI